MNQNLMNMPTLPLGDKKSSSLLNNLLGPSTYVQDLLLSQRIQKQRKTESQHRSSHRTPLIYAKQFSNIKARNQAVPLSEATPKAAQYQRSLHLPNSKASSSIATQPSFLYLQKQTPKRKKQKTLSTQLPALQQIEPVSSYPQFVIPDVVKENFHQKVETDSESPKGNDGCSVECLSQGSQERVGSEDREPSPVSIKNRFRIAVQKTSMKLSQGPKKLSIFNLIISPEFQMSHQEERMHIAEKAVAGNQILGQTIKFRKKAIRKIKEKQDFVRDETQKTIQQISSQKFQTSTQAFYRKIQMIKYSSTNGMQNSQAQHQFSLIPKSIRRTLERIQLPEAIINKSEKLKVTITFESKELVMEFNRPVYSKEGPTPLEKGSEDSYGPVFAKKASEKLIMQHQKSSRSLRPSFSTILNKGDEIDEQNLSNLNLNMEFNKANLYVRMYYQNKLYKLPKKSFYTSKNLTEIELDSNDRKQKVFMECDSCDKWLTTKQETFNKFKHRIDCTQKYQLSYDDAHFEFMQNDDLDVVQSSSDSDSSTSLEKLLESPVQSNPSHKFRLDSHSQIKSIQSKKLIDTEHISKEPVFIFDLFQNMKQISTGQLIPIKKIKRAFHSLIEFRPIINCLDPATKNELLTFEVLHEPVPKDFLVGDSDSQCIQKMDRYYKERELRQMIMAGLESRYEHILNGRYQGFTRMEDVEHQEEVPKDGPQKLANPSNKLITMPSDSHMQKSVHIMKLGAMKKSKDLGKIHSMKQKKPPNKTPNSPDLSNHNGNGNLSKPQTLLSNQFTNQIFTQTSTQFLTKPSTLSQNSLQRVSSARNFQLKPEHDISRQTSFRSLKSSTHSLLDKEPPPELKPTEESQIKTEKSPPLMRKDPEHPLHSPKKKQYLNSDKNQSMYQYSVRMRTHEREQARRQKLEVTELIRLAIEDNNVVEFNENFNTLPQMQIDVRLRDNNTFLTIAAQAGCKDIVKELLKRGVDINAQNNEGNTALHLALAYGQNKIADMLIEAGAHTNIINRYGKNAWSM